MILEGKRILVTGASRGIGRAMAKAAALEGATVGVHYHSGENEAHQLCAEIEAEVGRKAHPIFFDVRSPSEVESGVERFQEIAGGIDALVNNAARFEAGLLASMETDAIQRLISINLEGPIYTARAVLPYFLQQRSGVILNIGSVSASRPNQGQSVYAATKCALEGFTRALAIEYARKKIRVLCLSPGPIDTEMMANTRALVGDRIESRVPLGRVGQPIEVAQFAVQLLSDRMSFATGSIYSFDGGYLLG